MKLQIAQTGESVLRKTARSVSHEELLSGPTQQLIEFMRNTMRDAPGIGLAAPQVGIPLRLAVLEDRAEYHRPMPKDLLAALERKPVAFHAIVNPVITEREGSTEFYEGCLSVAGFSGLVERSYRIRVECWNEHAEPITIEATGWYARILQHEIDHLDGTLYIDRMDCRSFTTSANLNRLWQEGEMPDVRKAFMRNK